MREHDPAARALLAELLRLEAQRWPAVRPAYSAVLLTLADRCSTKPAKAEVYRWALRHIGGVLVDRDARWRECLVDGFHEAVALAPSILLRFRAGLDRSRRPNLRSMLAAWIHWRARDFFRSRHDRYARRIQVMTARGLPRQEVASPWATAVARQMIERLADEGLPSRGLLLHGVGYSVAEAARRTGASRQQIYRRRARLRVTDR